jgi:SAM-dependent methyltransferase
MAETPASAAAASATTSTASSAASPPLPSPAVAVATSATEVYGVSFERHLAQVTGRRANPMVQQLLKALGEAVVYSPDSNIVTNRKLWDNYALEWDPRAPWVHQMASHLPPEPPNSSGAGGGSGGGSGDAGGGGGGVGGAAGAAGAAVGAGDAGPASSPTCRASAGGEAPEHLRLLQHVGDEWSSRAHLQEVVQSFIIPFLLPSSTSRAAGRVVAAAEIGSGGGRIAVEMWPHVDSLTCFDISSNMLARCEAALAARFRDDGAGNGDDATRGASGPRGGAVREEGRGQAAAAASAPRQEKRPRKTRRFVRLGDQAPFGFEDFHHGAFDFVVCFDVMVHLDLHTIFQYLQHIRLLLKEGGHCFFSTANVLSPLGWVRACGARCEGLAENEVDSVVYLSV